MLVADGFDEADDPPARLSTGPTLVIPPGVDLDHGAVDEVLIHPAKLACRPFLDSVARPIGVGKRLELFLGDFALSKISNEFKLLGSAKGSDVAQKVFGECYARSIFCYGLFRCCCYGGTRSRSNKAPRFCVDIRQHGKLRNPSTAPAKGVGDGLLYFALGGATPDKFGEVHERHRQRVFARPVQFDGLAIKADRIVDVHQAFGDALGHESLVPMPAAVEDAFGCDAQRIGLDADLANLRPDALDISSVNWADFVKPANKLKALDKIH